MKTRDNPSRLLRSVPRSEVFYLLIVLVLALSIRLPRMDRGLGEDELDTVFYSVNARSIWQTISTNLSFNNHIGYSLVARVSRALFGPSEWAFRLPALLFGLAGLFVFWIFIRSILGPRLAIVGTLLYAFCPAQIIWSITGRGYSGMLLFSLLASYLFLRLLQYPTRRKATLFVVASVLGIYTFLYSAFVTMVQSLYVLRLRISQRPPKQRGTHIPMSSLRVLFFCLVTVASLSILCYSPALRSLLHDLKARGQSNFDPFFPWRVVQYLSGSDGAPLAVVVFMVSVSGFLSLLQSHRREVGYFALLLVGPLVVMWVARPYDLYPRFFSYWLPYYVVFFVAGLRTLWYLAARHYRRLIRYSSPLCTSAIAGIVLLSWSMGWQNWILDEGYRDASRALAANAGESVVFCAIGGDGGVFQYYFDKPIVVPTTMADFLELARANPEVRCVYHPASWESPDHTQIAQYLKENGSSSTVKKMVLFTLRK